MHLFENSHSQPGAVPGTVLVERHAQQPQLTATPFGPKIAKADIISRPMETVAALAKPTHAGEHLWLEVNGLGDADTLRAVGEQFSIHPLALEDIANTSQRPKIEVFDECIFMVLRVPVYAQSAADKTADEPTAAILQDTHQLAMCIGENFVITFQETAEPVVDVVKNRLLHQKGQLYRLGPDYLAYALLDAAIDMYFPLMEIYGEYFEDIEAAILEDAARSPIQAIHELKHELSVVRRIAWSLKDMTAKVQRVEEPFIRESTKLYFRDCRDNTMQLLDRVEMYQDTSTSLVNISLSIQSNKMNDVMRVLTVIATIFIPLSWIAGIYGMNFDPDSPWNMPELAWKYGYLATLSLMGIIAGGLLLWFWRKGWIGRPKK